jgi:hypothetical protein
MKNLTYKVEENHRGKWIPLKAKETDKQKIVKITERTASIMNMDSKVTKIRYVLADEQPSGGDGNEAPTMENTKAEIVQYLNDQEIEIPSEATTKALLLELIK